MNETEKAFKQWLDFILWWYKDSAKLPRKKKKAERLKILNKFRDHIINVYKIIKEYELRQHE